MLRKGLIWIHMVRFTLILLLLLRMLAIGVNHKWDACPSKDSTQAPFHPHIKLSKYRTRIKPTWWKWLDENPVYPQELFAYHKRLFLPVLCLKRIALPWCTFTTIIITCSLQNILLSNYSVTYNFSTCRHYLAENHLSFPCAPRWVRYSYLSKRATIDPLYLWVIKAIFRRRCRGVKRLW